MTYNKERFEQNMLTFADFMRGQSMVIERCGETICACATMKLVAESHNGKKRVAKFIADVQGKLPAGLYIELTKDKDRVYILTDTTDTAMRDRRVSHRVLCTFWVSELTEEGRISADKIAAVADKQIAESQARRAIMRDGCREFERWSATLLDAVDGMYRKIMEGIPAWFMELESVYVGDLPLW